MKKKCFVLTLALLLGFSSYAQDFSALKVKLETISDSSLLLRRNVMPIIKKHGAGSSQLDSLNKVIIKHDSLSLLEVQRVLDGYGWLGISQIGEKANDALYLTIQHAQDNRIREKYFPLLEASAKKGESRLTDMATMKDRMLVERGEKQVYGTQYKLLDGNRVLLPIQDTKRLNKRRKKVGLEEIELSLLKVESR